MGKISVPNGTFNAEFKYVSSFSLSPTVVFFFVTAKLNVKKCVYLHISLTTKFNFFWAQSPAAKFNVQYWSIYTTQQNA
jgi:hypothetical protein